MKVVKEIKYGEIMYKAEYDYDCSFQEFIKDLLENYKFTFSIPSESLKKLEYEIRYKLSKFFSFKNYNEAMITYNLILYNDSYETKINCNAKNFYTKLIFDGIDNPEEYIKAGFHRLLDNGKYENYGMEKIIFEVKN